MGRKLHYIETLYKVDILVRVYVCVSVCFHTMYTE